ncbi:MAG: hypothetical protein IJX30_07020 [Clostridia bacterium]|nr:hypothetical protein [Clostridia bacterium]
MLQNDSGERYAPRVGFAHSVGMTVNRKVSPLGMTSIPNSKLSGMTRAVLQRECPLTGSK